MSDTALNDLPFAVCAAIDARLPELRECKPIFGKFNLAELKKRGSQTPAVLVSVIKAVQDPGTGFIKNYMLDMAAYVITSNTTSQGKRDEHAANIAQVLMSLIPEHRWEAPGSGAARNVQLHPMITPASRDQGTTLWAVQWDQPLTLRPAVDAPLGVDLYVSLARNDNSTDSFERIGEADDV